jgi:uncharacterized protein YkwD
MIVLHIQRLEVLIMLRFFATLIIILVTFAACSRTANPVVPEDSADTFESSVDLPENFATPSHDGASEIWASVQVSWDPQSGEVSFVSRSLEIESRHYRVSSFLNPPNCTDCIGIEQTGGDAEIGLGVFRLSLKNPTQLVGYDIRGVLQVGTGIDLRVLNPDGYTNLYATAGYVTPSPFITFASMITDHAFAPGSTLSETVELKTGESHWPVNFIFLVTAGYPSPPGDVSSISEFRQTGQLLSGGGNAFLSFNVEDMQDDITGVIVRASELGAGDLSLSESDGRWEGTLINYSAVPGIYNLRVDAMSPNPQNGVTSHYYRAVVFHDLTSFRTELLNSVNADRAANGQSALSIDAALNTVAQFHAQDMCDLHYFSHTNLDGWSPWRRMSYYGVGYHAAGENIAVGQDTPTEVENAWMNSSGHRANILNGSFDRIGIGIVPTQSGDKYHPGYYWVQLFTD